MQPTFSTRPRSRLRTSLLLCGTLGLALLSSCATGPRSVTQSPEILRHESQAYHPAGANTSNLVRFALGYEDGSRPGNMYVTLPGSGSTPFPVVVLLPALGEDGDGARFWVDTLAHAGYAVLCLQPLAQDAAAWQTDRARSGDFAGIARERFDAQLVPTRVQALARSLRYAQARALAGEPLPKGPRGALDWSRIAYVGFDLGADTVQAIASGQGTDLPAGRALVVLGPVTRVGQEYPVSTHPPILFVSGIEESDPYGLLGDAASWHRAFDALGPGPSSYLEVRLASHSLLRGVPIPEPILPVAQMHPDEGPPGANGPGRGRSQGGDRSARGADPFQDDLLDGGEPLDQRRQRVQKKFEEERNIAMRRWVARMDVSTMVLAHLDAWVIDSAVARDWIQGGKSDAWLGDSGRLKRHE